MKATINHYFSAFLASFQEFSEHFTYMATTMKPNGDNYLHIETEEDWIGITIEKDDANLPSFRIKTKNNTVDFAEKRYDDAVRFALTQLGFRTHLIDEAQHLIADIETLKENGKVPTDKQIDKLYNVLSHIRRNIILDKEKELKEKKELIKQN